MAARSSLSAALPPCPHPGQPCSRYIASPWNFPNWLRLENCFVNWCRTGRHHHHVVSRGRADQEPGEGPSAGAGCPHLPLQYSGGGGKCLIRVALGCPWHFGVPVSPLIVPVQPVFPAPHSLRCMSGAPELQAGFAWKPSPELSCPRPALALHVWPHCVGALPACRIGSASGRTREVER